MAPGLRALPATDRGAGEGHGRGPGANSAFGTGQFQAKASGRTGKVHRQNRGLIYDHFGDFRGFLLETVGCDVRRFDSRGVRMEGVVREAWEIRATVHVIVESDRPHCPLEVIVGGVRI